MTDEITREVEIAVHAAARSAGGYRGELCGVYRRARRRRTRNAVLACAAGVLVLLGAGAVLRGSDLHATPLPAASLPDAPQRLLLSGVEGTFGTTETPAVHLSSSTRIGEILADGRLTTHPVVGVQAWQQYAELPDGRIVALASQDTADTLLVVDAGGKVESAQNVRALGERVELLTASETTAYLWRPDGLMARDLTTGVETAVMTAGDLQGINGLASSILAADVGAGELAVAPVKRPCRPYVQRLGSGAPISAVDMTVPGWDCAAVVALRLSPDGSGVAAVYRTGASGYRLVVAGTGEGQVLVDHALDGSGRAVNAVLAWRDDHTVRGVLVPSGGGTHELTPFTAVTG